MEIINVTNDARFARVKLGEIKPNRFRDLKRWPVEREVIDALKKSINETGFWNNLQAIRNELEEIELRFGHHRLTAGLEMFGPDYEVAVEIVPFDSEWGLLRALHMENSVHRNRVTHTHEVVHQLTHWWDDTVFDDAPTWEECERTGFLTSPFLERYFGPKDTKQTGPANYARCAKYGIGREVIAKMLDGESTESVKQTLANLPLTERRKRGIELAAEEERRTAEAKKQEAERLRQEQIKRHMEAAEQQRKEREEQQEAERIRAEAEAAEKEARAQKNREKMAEAMAKAKEAEKRMKAAQKRAEEDARRYKEEEEARKKEEARLESEARLAEVRAEQKLGVIESREWFDPKAAEVFDKHSHGAAFRIAVMDDQIRPYLTTDSLEPFAQAIRDALEKMSEATGRELLIADNIRRAVKDNFRTFHNGIKLQHKEEREQEERNNPVLVTKRKMDEASAALKDASAKLGSLQAWMAQQKITGTNFDAEFSAHANEVMKQLTDMGFAARLKTVAA